MPDDKDLIESLRSAVISSDLTVYALAQKAGVSPGMISRFMSGTSDLKLATAAKLAHALGMELVRR